MAERINPCANPDCICNCGDCPLFTGFKVSGNIRFGDSGVNRGVRINPGVMKSRAAQRGEYVLTMSKDIVSLMVG